MKITAKTVVLTTAAALITTGAAWAVPTVSDVQMTQLPGTRHVQVTYNLADEEAIVTLSIETNGVAIPESAVTRLLGDVCKVVQPGTGRSIIWNAGADWSENLTDSAKARVTAWSTNAPPLYCVVDLAGGAVATNYPVAYYTSAEALPEGGLTNSVYKLTRLVMRRIRTQAAYPENGAFKMGSPVGELGRDSGKEEWHDVVLDNDFYAGVFQVTQSQWQQVMNLRPSLYNNADYWMARPVEKVSYFDIRENPAGVGITITPNWPQSDAVHSASFVGRMRAKTGLAGFDLPTEAQWEYACRAGTTGTLNDGTVNITNLTSDARLSLLGRYAYNGGKINGTVDPVGSCTPENGTATVGSYAPNTWGLYDMHGNVWEWCLDWFVRSLGTDPVVNPKGATEGATARVQRGGGWSFAGSGCRSASRDGAGPSYRAGTSFGFRLFRTLP